MAKYVHGDVLDKGLNELKNFGTNLLVLKAYTLGDSYATVIGNKLSDTTISSADMIITGGDAAAHVLTVAAKSDTADAGSGASPDLHIAITDGTSRVLAVTDETSDQVVTLGNTINIPSWTVTAAQPT
ncbi:MAG TPA: hypothetical protein VFS89_00990 [Nitrosospira sp.]|nr:hypothetical protein [Nitrosospira sp.]